MDDINIDWQYKYGYHAVRHSNDPRKKNNKWGEGISFGPVVSFGQIHSINSGTEFNQESIITPIKLKMIVKREST